MKNKIYIFMKVPLSLFFILLLVSSVSQATIFPEKINLKEDTLLKKNDKNTNFVSAPTLNLVGGGSSESRALLSFNLDITETFTNFDEPDTTCSIWDVGVQKVELEVDVSSPAQCGNGGCYLFAYPIVSQLTDGPGLDLSLSTWKCANSNDCRQKWNGGSHENASGGAVIVPDGFVGKLRFDVTAEAKLSTVGKFNPSWLIDLAGNSSANVVLAADSAKIVVTNEAVAETEEELYSFGLGRNSVVLNVSDLGTVSSQAGTVEVSYLTKSGPEGITFLITHGIPSFSYMFRNVIMELSEIGTVYAMDWPGTGRSQNINDFPVYDYSVDSEARLYEAFVDQMGITGDVVVIINERGGIPGLHFINRNYNNSSSPINITGMVMAAEPWVGACPDDEIGNYGLWFSGQKAGEPPFIFQPDGTIVDNPGGKAYCSQESAVPFWGDPWGFPSFAFSFPVWDIFRSVYWGYPYDQPSPNIEAACQNFLGGVLYDEDGRGGFVGGIANLFVGNRNNEAVLQEYMRQFSDTPYDPSDKFNYLAQVCATDENLITMYPRQLPFPNSFIPGFECGPDKNFCENPESRTIFNDYTAALKTGGNLDGLPRLMLLSDGSLSNPVTASIRLVGKPSQAIYAEDELGFDARCIGTAGHLAIEDVPLNTADRIIDFLSDNNIL